MALLTDFFQTDAKQNRDQKIFLYFSLIFILTHIKILLEAQISLGMSKRKYTDYAMLSLAISTCLCNVIEIEFHNVAYFQAFLIMN